MDDVVTTDHDALADLLPDYALGSLDDGALRRVAAHLERCPACRHGLAQLLETVALLPGAPSPSPTVRGAVLARAVAMRPDLAVARQPVPMPLLNGRSTSAGAGADGPRPVRRSGWVGRLPAAAAIALLVTLGTWNLQLRHQVGDPNLLAGFLDGRVAAHPLNDSELSPPATGVLIAGAGSDRALLVANDLPPLPADRRYQIWLITEDGERVSAGLFDVGETGHAQVEVRVPTSIASYMAVGVSAEPRDGSPDATAPLALGAWLPD